jgi:ribosomal protein S18 acetylase RimI-like enzyme
MKIRRANKSDLPAIARVHLECWRLMYSALVPEGVFHTLEFKRDQRWAQFLDSAQHGDEIALVAESSGNKVIGFAHAGPEWGGHPTIESELYALFVLPEYQGRGVGKRLLLATASALVRRNSNSMLVRVRSGNPTPRVYQALGADNLGMQSVSVDGVAVQEIAYGWNNLKTLLEREKEVASER